MNYLCPKCNSNMNCICLTSNPPIMYYNCPHCGYKSKSFSTYLPNPKPLPEWLRQDEKESKVTE